MSDYGRGLYEKFRVERNDGSSKPGKKHARCEYFVLDLDHDKHARAALFAYADSCEAEYPQLAADLRAKFQKDAAASPGEQGELADALREMEDAVMDTFASGRPVAHLDSVFGKLKVAILRRHASPAIPGELVRLSEKVTQGEWPAMRVEPQTAAAYFSEPYCPWSNLGPRPVTGDKGAVIGIHADDMAFVAALVNWFRSLSAAPAIPEGCVEREAAFGRLVLDESRNEITDLDGGWIQDKAEELGLLVRVQVTESCGEDCRCAEYGDFPQECLRIASAAPKPDEQKKGRG